MKLPASLFILVLSITCQAPERDRKAESLTNDLRLIQFGLDNFNNKSVLRDFKSRKLRKMNEIWKYYSEK